MPPAANRAAGFALVAFGVTLLAGFLYAAVLSKVLPPPDNWFLLAIRNDRFAFSRFLTSPEATVHLLSPFVLRSERVRSPELLLIFRYYCLLVPLTVPVIIVAVYLHWMSMKMFKHA
jgi:predicted permease